ncbi:hypothetical protein QBC38DRAFT_505654 [Podospora fimiseda]|uniref:Uncharacterized protein n=1 Tax=Podospora fimiseda TaxID=252190 RepID=A0AAN7BE81_9PEZI|nr:hypothetical protein QBC38DRAFT_505654 [Podospora fimiseda]
MNEDISPDYNAYPLCYEIDQSLSNCQINATTYTDPLTPQVQTLSSIAAKAANWVKLEPETCLKEYVTCRGLLKYRDLVLVVKQGPNTTWARNTVWDPVVPIDKDNSLWYWQKCWMGQDRFGDPVGLSYCRNICTRQMGIFDRSWSATALVPNLSRDSSWNTGLYYTGSCYEPSYYTVELSNSNTCTWPLRNKSIPLGNSSIVYPKFRLSFNYCLAEPIERECTYVSSNTFLLIVTMCVLINAVTCAIVVAVIRNHQAPLVTIDKPRRGYSAVTRGDRITSLYLFVFGSAAALAFVYTAGNGIIESSSLLNLFSEDNHDTGLLAEKGAWGDKQGSPFDGISVTLVVNSAQLLLSLWYLHYNQIITQLVMAREWAQFSIAFKPLHVTRPRGQQVSTYFLQLPYRYSIPLITISTILHWMLFRAIYVFFWEGKLLLPQSRKPPQRRRFSSRSKPARRHYGRDATFKFNRFIGYWHLYRHVVISCRVVLS